MVFLKIENISKCYRHTSPFFQPGNGDQYAVKNVSFDIHENEILALVGESGSGKTTLGRCLIRLIEPNSGAVYHQGENLIRLREKEFRRYRRQFQMIFQNPDQALNPRQTVASCLAEPIRVHDRLTGSGLSTRISEILRMVGLTDDLLSRYPHELSGGQQQRVVIARALATRPIFLIADEPTSSLDAILRRQVISLLKSIQQKLGLTILLISHDIALVSQLADRIGVMVQGQIVEIAPRDRLLKSPSHAYSKLLLKSYHMNFKPTKVRAVSKI